MGVGQPGGSSRVRSLVVMIFIFFLLTFDERDDGTNDLTTRCIFLLEVYRLPFFTLFSSRVVLTNPFFSNVMYVMVFLLILGVAENEAE